jgi:hypothetical protein
VPIKSERCSVPDRTSIKTTSAGMLTSDAPLSITKFRVIALFIRTGTTYVPPFSFTGIKIAPDEFSLSGCQNRREGERQPSSVTRILRPTAADHATPCRPSSASRSGQKIKNLANTRGLLNANPFADLGVCPGRLCQFPKGAPSRN